MPPKPPAFVANFDSSTAMVRALGQYLHGRDFPALGESPVLKLPAARANVLPPRLRRALYIFSGRQESIPPKKIDSVDAEELARWVAAVYPRRPYPAVAVGSSNGAAVHLWAALGVPWLPQTFLVPVRQSVHPDEPADAMRMGLEPGRTLLERNPDLQLHHMHDANQDRLMIRTMTYFRVKRRRLGWTYERLLQERLPPGGTIFVVDCQRSWAVTRIADRQVFQHGAVGGATEEEFQHGSDRVAEYLERHGSPYRRWYPPVPDQRAPEAEWGFEPAIMEDIARVAEERRYRVVRIRFPEPQSLSPLVVDLYRWWYRRRKVPADRLLVESFIVLEPYWALRTGSAPFWMEFNMEPSLRALEAYLDSSDPFDEIYMMLFNHGVEAVGLPAIPQWEKVLSRARKAGRWVGAEPPEFPMDYAQFARYHDAVQRIPGRYPRPAPMPLRWLETFLSQHGHRYDVEVEEEKPPVRVG